MGAIRGMRARGQAKEHDDGACPLSPRAPHECREGVACTCSSRVNRETDLPLDLAAVLLAHHLLHIGGDGLEHGPARPLDVDKEARRVGQVGYAGSPDILSLALIDREDDVLDHCEGRVVLKGAFGLPRAGERCLHSLLDVGVPRLSIVDGIRRRHAESRQGRHLPHPIHRSRSAPKREARRGRRKP